MTDRVDTIVAGAGVVGLAIARALSMKGLDILVLEAETTIGTGISSRNSEVIHAGIYYPPDSLKAKLCVAGREKLYDYCRDKDISHARLGKLIVATTPEEIPALEAIARRALENGLSETDITPCSVAKIKRFSPELQCVAALSSQVTGIIDSHALMLALRGDAEANGAMIVCRAPILSGEITAQGFEFEIGGSEPTRIACRNFINAAGLGAVALARSIGGIPAQCVPQQFLCKGSYFTLRGHAPFQTLIYPIPEHAGLGIHMTLDLDKNARFGPDVEWIDQPDYAVSPDRAAAFTAAIRRYWPGLPDDALIPAYSGIRPKISGPGEPVADFRIDGPELHGIPGLVNLFGIESPGLTSSLAIGQHVAAMFAL